jgi:hypothetical protein
MHPLYGEVANDMELCLAKLNRMERHIANGEVSPVALVVGLRARSDTLQVLGVSLLLEDISEQEVDPSQTKDPTQLYQVLMSFLKIAIQMEQLRFAWAKHVLNMVVDSPAKLGIFTKMYDTQVVAPVVAQLKQQHLKVRLLSNPRSTRFENDSCRCRIIPAAVSKLARCRAQPGCLLGMVLP